MPIIDFTLPRRILDKLSGKAEDFYLASGNALSMAYFYHRESYDVDLFTREFSRQKVKQVIDQLREGDFCSAEETGVQLSDTMAKMLVYTITFKDGAVCKLDFMEDVFDLLKPLQKINGIQTLSLEDIYLRKISAIAGYIVRQNAIGRDIVIGGRQEAKDLYDVYCLSSIATPLSEFVARYGNETMIEAVIRWHQTYDRLQMKTGLLDLITAKALDTREIEIHFNKQIEKLIRSIL